VQGAAMSAPARPHDAGEIRSRDGGLSLPIILPPLVTCSFYPTSFVLIHCDINVAIRPGACLPCGARSRCAVPTPPLVPRRGRLLACPPPGRHDNRFGSHAHLAYNSSLANPGPIYPLVFFSSFPALAPTAERLRRLRIRPKSRRGSKASFRTPT